MDALRKRTRIAALVGIAVVAVACPKDTPVFDQSDFDSSAVISGLGTGQQAAGKFVLASGLTTVSRVDRWGSQPAGTAPCSLIVRIFQDDGTGEPQTEPLYSIPVGTGSRNDTGVVGTSGECIYKYTASVGPITFSSGQSYYLSVLGQGASQWSWSQTSDTTPIGTAYWRTGEGASWAGPESIDMAFRLWE